VKISQILLVLGALPYIAPAAIAQESGLANETVIIQVNDHLITKADIMDEARRLLHQNPLMAQQASEVRAYTNLVQQGLLLQAAAELAVPLKQYFALADEFVLKEIERAGSMNNFLLEKNNELGILEIEEFRDYIYNNFVYTHVLRIVAGSQQTAGKGFRVILEPSPKEIRHAYKENHEYRMAPAILKWSYLKFYQKGDSAQAHKDMVGKALTDLENGAISMQELIDLADDAIANTGQPEDTAAWVLDFVSSASTGAYKIGPKSNFGSQGTVSLVVITENTPPKEYPFTEAQSIIAKRLMGERRIKVIDDFFKETATKANIWVTGDIPGLKDFISQMIGRDILTNTSSKNSEEL
tara:strand:- start:146 stop:1207 length:1062 start_codon:yes stop_codon:yes gene_type:complete